MFVLAKANKGQGHTQRTLERAHEQVWQDREEQQGMMANLARKTKGVERA